MSQNYCYYLQLILKTRQHKAPVELLGTYVCSFSNCNKLILSEVNWGQEYNE